MTTLRLRAADTRDDAAPDAAAASRLVLDAQSWALLVRGCRAPGLPPSMAPGSWAGVPEDDAARDGAAGQQAQAAWRRLTAAGVLALDERAAGPAWVVHPGVLSVLAAVTAGPVRISVRSWTADREVLAEVGVVAGRAAALARRRILDSEGRPVADEPWLELSELAAGDVVDELVRAMPGDLDSRRAGTEVDPRSALPVTQTPAELPVEVPVEVPVEGSLALVAALRAGREDLAAALVELDGEATGTGTAVAPDTLSDVALRVRGGVDVEARVVTVGGEVVARSVGVWVLTGFGPVAVRPAAVDAHGAVSSVRLVRTDAAGVRADLVSAVTAAFSAASALAPGRDADE